MRIPAALGLLVVAAGCATVPDPSEPQGEKHLAFEGVTGKDEAALRELIAPDLKRYVENPRDTVLDDAAFRLRYHYQFEGHADVKVEYERTPTKVIFRIQPGPQVTLGRVHFVGNTVFTNEELRSARPKGFLGESVPYSERLVTMLRGQVLSEYVKKGYIEAEVEVKEARNPDEPDRAHLTFEIREGARFTLAGIDGMPADPELSEKLAKFVREPYTPGIPEQVEATVIDHYREHGRPFARAIVTPRIDPKSASVRLELDAHAGPEAKIGPLRIAGSRQARDSFVRQRVDLEEGQPYRATDFHRAEERLLKTQIFKSARVSPGDLKEETGELTVDVTVEEKEAGEFAVRGGWGSQEGLRGGADLSYHDLLGGAELVRVGGTVSQIGFRTDAELAFPYFLGTEFRPGVTGWLEDQQLPSFDASSHGVLGSLAHRFSDRLSASAGARYAIIRTSNVNPAVPPGDLLDFAYTALSLSGTADFVDNPRLPTQGVYATAEVDWSPQSFRSDVVFVSASGRVSGYLPLPLDLVLASSFQGGIILPRGKTQEIPISLRFFAGGETTVRGFKLDTIGPLAGGEPTGGEVYMAVQSELRFPIWGDVHGAVFSDQGGVWFDHNRVAIDEARASVGLGLRYYTAAGAFVLDVGWNPHPYRQYGERPVEVQFSIGFPF
jgi:outer membrane protein assembly complex protein YaeT